MGLFAFTVLNCHLYLFYSGLTMENKASNLITLVGKFNSLLFIENFANTNTVSYIHARRKISYMNGIVFCGILSGVGIYNNYNNGPMQTHR